MRDGVDASLSEREGGHALFPVYTEMLHQCALNYAGLPDPRTLTLSEIRFFYEGLRPTLWEATKPRPDPKK